MLSLFLSHPLCKFSCWFFTSQPIHFPSSPPLLTGQFHFFHFCSSSSYCCICMHHLMILVFSIFILNGEVFRVLLDCLETGQVIFICEISRPFCRFFFPLLWVYVGSSGNSRSLVKLSNWCVKASEDHL